MLATNPIQQLLCCADSVRLAQSVPALLYSHETVITGIEHNLHHSPVVDSHFISLAVELTRFRAHTFGERHHLLDTFIAVVLFAVPEVEVSEVGQGAASRMVDLPDNGRQPGSIRRQTAMILNDEVD